MDSDAAVGRNCCCQGVGIQQSAASKSLPFPAFQSLALAPPTGRDVVCRFQEPEYKMDFRAGDKNCLT